MSRGAFVALLAILVGMPAGVSEAGVREWLKKKPCAGEGCPPPAAPTAPPAAAPAPVAEEPAAPPLAPAAPTDSALLDDALASAPELASSPQAIAPFMLGDSLGSGAFVSFAVMLPNEDIAFGQIPLPNTSSFLQRLRISDNNSPMPRDRVFATYNHFQNAINAQTAVFDFETVRQSSSSLSIDQAVFGVEKTFLNGMMSLEVRVPFSRTLNNDIYNDLSQSNAPLYGLEGSTEFGNVSVVYKSLIFANPTLALSAGCGLATPTGPSASVATQVEDTLDVIRIQNNTLTVQPFLGYLITPNERLFVQGFAQFDLPVNSDPISRTYTDSQFPQENFTIQASLRDQSVFRWDAALGYWTYLNPGGRLSGIAPTVEVHHTTTLENADIVSLNNPDFFDTFFVGNVYNRVDLWNITLGGTVVFGNRLLVASGFVIPMGTYTNQAFDWEYQLRVNFRFGPAPLPGSRGMALLRGTY